MNSTKLVLLFLLSEMLVCDCLANGTDPTIKELNRLDDPMSKCEDEFCWPKCCPRNQYFIVDSKECGPLPGNSTKSKSKSK